MGGIYAERQRKEKYLSFSIYANHKSTWEEYILKGYYVIQNQIIVIYLYS